MPQEVDPTTTAGSAGSSYHSLLARVLSLHSYRVVRADVMDLFKYGSCFTIKTLDLSGTKRMRAYSYLFL